MVTATSVRALVRRDCEVDVSIEKDIIEDFFIDVENATEEQASECLGCISSVVCLRFNPWRFHHCITKDESGVTMDWEVYDDGETLVDGKITGRTLVDVTHKAATLFGVFSYEGLDF